MEEAKLKDEIIQKIKQVFINSFVELEDLESLEKNLFSSNLNNIINIPKLIESLTKVVQSLEDKSINNFITEIEKRHILDSIIHVGKKTKNFKTKLENIIEKLNEIRNEAVRQNDIDSIEDIDWIIITLNQENIYEIDPIRINYGELNSEENKSGLNFLMQYSKMEEMKLKANDFILVRTNTRSKTYSSNLDMEMVLQKGRENKRRKESPRLMGSDLISPSVAAKINTILLKLDCCNFDIFALDELMGEKASELIVSEILNNSVLVKNKIVDTQTLRNFINKVVISYNRKKAYYHNDLHGADVMQTMFVMMRQGNMKKKMKLNELDIFSMLIGAFCHDLKHPGQNNAFHVNSRSKIAMKYNDISVLENYHIAQTFKILNEEKYNILKNLKPEEYRIVRRRIIDEIFATDMSNHQKILSSLKGKIETYKISKGENFEKIFNVESEKLFDAQQTILNMAIHTADISNPAKPYKISEAWVEKVYGEFFIQGDLEKSLGMQVSMMCDRETTNINKAMIGFINFIVKPSIDIFINLVPELSEFGDCIQGNLKKYEKLLEEEKKRKNKGKCEQMK